MLQKLNNHVEGYTAFPNGDLATITKVERKISYPPRQGEGNKFRDKAMERGGFFF
jgi:hypothetical protein